METAIYYRAKAAELRATADLDASCDHAARWRRMADTWADLAERVDAEERYFLRYPQEG